MNCQNELRVLDTLAALLTPPGPGTVTVITKCLSSTFPSDDKLVSYPLFSRQEEPVQGSRRNFADAFASNSKGWRGPFGLFPSGPASLGSGENETSAWRAH